MTLATSLMYEGGGFFFVASLHFSVTSFSMLWEAKKNWVEKTEGKENINTK